MAAIILYIIILGVNPFYKMKRIIVNGKLGVRDNQTHCIV